MARLAYHVLTKSLDIETKISAFAVGGDDYLHKPFDIRKLNLRTKAVLRRSQFANETEVESGGEADIESQRKAALQIGALRLDTNKVCYFGLKCWLIAAFAWLARSGWLTVAKC